MVIDEIVPETFAYLSIRGNDNNKSNYPYNVTSLSVVIPAYNEEKTISDVIEGVKRSTQGLDTEIIVINDKGTDRTEEEKGS